MATTAKKANEIQEGYEEVFVPRAHPGEERDLFISVNGENFLLPKGKTSIVPSYIAKEYRRSLDAQARLDARVDEMIAESQKTLH